MAKKKHKMTPWGRLRIQAGTAKRHGRHKEAKRLRAEADRLAEALGPLFDIVTVKTQEDSPFGPRACKARNPLPVKTLMRVFGMPVGPVRQPLGKMTPAGLQVVLAAARSVWADNPQILRPVGEAFDVDVERRLSEPQYWQDLCYQD